VNKLNISPELRLPSCVSPELRLARIAPREYAALFASLKRTNLWFRSLLRNGSNIISRVFVAKNDYLGNVTIDQSQTENLKLYFYQSLVSYSSSLLKIMFNLLIKIFNAIKISSVLVHASLPCKG
jgi:hypothetical protein